MKILVFAHNNHLYGANRSLLSVLLYLKKNNYKITVLLPGNGDFKTKLDDEGIENFKIFYFPFFLYYKFRLKYLALPIMWIYNLFVFPFLLLKVKSINPDIIYSNTAAENMGILLAKALNIKHVWHIREFMDKDHGANFIFGNDLKSKYYNQSDGLMFVSNAVSTSILCDKKVAREVIYNGISPVREDFQKIKSSNQRLKLGVVGVIDPSKGQDKAILYFASLLKINPNTELHIYGENGGFFLKELNKIILENDLSQKVFFRGFEKDISKIYENIDILLMTSRNEAFGRVTVEAMLHGIPVIGFNKGGTSELINNGETGYLFDNEEQFISAFRELNNESNYNYISQSAKSKAIVDYKEEKYTCNVLSFILKTQ